MSFKDQITNPTTRVTELVGRNVTVYNYTYSTTDDDYGDPEWTEDSGTTVTAKIEEAEKPEHRTGDDGSDTQVDYRVLLPNDVTVRDGTSGNEARATEIVDDETGRRYEVISVFPESNGLNRARCLTVNN